MTTKPPFVPRDQYGFLGDEIRAGRVPDYALKALLGVDPAFAEWFAGQEPPPNGAAPAAAQPAPSEAEDAA